MVRSFPFAQELDYVTDNARIDLMNIDIASGNCVNPSVPQNVTFGEQGGVLGDNSNAASRAGATLGWGAVVVVGLSALVGLMGV